MNSRQFYDKYKRDPESRRFYKSAAWSKARKLALERDNYLCVHHLKRKQIVPADMVHHIKELRDYPELALTLDNLVSLCNACHEAEHPDRGRSKPKKKKSKINVIKSQANQEVT
ncbi:HNH endonuclease [Niallia sp. FSL W8-1348]|uniref:HNH endonuclease n=1 Tax=Niallia sp. FSL W8-1348 TaxID=2954656 RepID=UPI0030F9FAF0